MIRVEYRYDLNKFEVYEYGETTSEDKQHGFYDTHEEAQKEMIRIYEEGK
jgi:hypothetical protein